MEQQKIKIITDSAADIPVDIAEKLNISIIPLGIVIDDKIYFDNVDIKRREYLEKLPNYDVIPTTSMPPIASIEDEFRKNLDNYEHQIFITISKKSSGENNGALMLKEQIEEELGHTSNITVLDSGSFTMVYGRIVIKMAEMAQNNESYEDIINYFNEFMPKSSAYFYVNDLNHLKKGGRINAGAALIGTMLGIKPILTISEGLVDSVGKERGKIKALDKIVEKCLSEADDIDNQDIIVANGGADEDIALLIKKIKEKCNPKSITEIELGCTIATHAGPGLVGFIFSK